MVEVIWVVVLELLEIEKQYGPHTPRSCSSANGPLCEAISGVQQKGMPMPFSSSLRLEERRSSHALEAHLGDLTCGA